MYEKEYANFRIPVGCLAQGEINQRTKKSLLTWQLVLSNQQNKYVWKSTLVHHQQETNYKEIIVLYDNCTAWIC